MTSLAALRLSRHVPAAAAPGRPRPRALNRQAQAAAVVEAAPVLLALRPLSPGPGRLGPGPGARVRRLSGQSNTQREPAGPEAPGHAVQLG
jgi:hypothetical protein